MNGTLTQKACLALAALADRDEVNSVQIEEWRDPGDVGWILATVHRPRRGSGTALPWTVRVSPTGRVFQHRDDWANHPVELRGDHDERLRRLGDELAGAFKHAPNLTHG